MVFFNRDKEAQRVDAQQKMLLEVLDRVTRLESRLVQLMYFLGADVNTRYESKFSNRKGR